MEKRKFIYQIETEPIENALIRVLMRFARNRIPIESMETNYVSQQSQKISISVSGTREKMNVISKKIECEVDVVSVILFEQAN